MDEKANLPPSELYRRAAKEWVALDGAARLMEETKHTVLSQSMKALGDMPVAHAEREVRSSKEWEEFIRKMCEARTKANLAKVKTEFYRMKFMEEQSANATARAEMRL